MVRAEPVIQSANGVISTSNDDVMHMAYQNLFGEWVNCETPYHLHRRPDGEWMSCAEAAKFSQGGMMGAKMLKSDSKQQKEEGQQYGTNVPVNLPR